MFVNPASNWKRWTGNQESLILNLTTTVILTLGKSFNLAGIRLEGTSLLLFTDFLSDIQRPTPILLCS